MLLLPFLLVPAALASPLSLLARENDNPPTSNQTTPNVIRSTWDGQCFYPTADETFHLPSYLGKWFQIAGTIAPFTAGCSCITAEYSLNENGTVDVQNTCQAAGRTVPIRGTAEVADAAYGSKGVLRVQFPGQPAPECPGPNYIVQDYTGDFAIVQASNFSTLFVLSRQQVVDDSVIDAWIERAGKLGSDLGQVAKTNQTGCS